MAAYLKAFGDLVEYPGPLLGEADKGYRAVNQCMAATAAVRDLPAVEAARILAHAAATIEEEPEGSGCMSTPIGEAVRLQAGELSEESLEVNALQLENASLGREVTELGIMEKELEAGAELNREIRDLKKPGRIAGRRKPSDVH